MSIEERLKNLLKKPGDRVELFVSVDAEGADVELSLYFVETDVDGLPKGSSTVVYGEESIEAVLELGETA